MSGLTANFEVTFHDKEFNAIGAVEFNKMIVNIGMDGKNAAADGSPYLTGHNAASVGLVPSDGKILGRKSVPGAAMAAGRPARAADGLNVARKNGVAIVTSSGYGGILEVGTRRMPGRFYMMAALIATMKNWKRHADAANLEITKKMMQVRK